MRVDSFHYDLPLELIAQKPLERRDASRMLVLARASGEWQDSRFAELPTLLRGDEMLVLNNARVIPARLFGHRIGVHSQTPSKKTRREHLSGVVEVFLVKKSKEDTWEALVRPGRKMQTGERVIFGEGELEGEIVGRGERGLRTIAFRATDGQPAQNHLERLGHVPLPPYIERADEDADRERYQTVFSRRGGAIAAPTAGLHFTPELLSAIRAKGCEVCELTLDVGLGTFQPVKTEQMEEHAIHSESYEIDHTSAEKIAAAKRQGRRILAIGTTVVRALEDSAARAALQNTGRLLTSGQAEASIFILPGFTFRVVDALLTNFHLPQSTLLALVSAFAGREHILAAYAHAVKEKYRFFSYGDCMLIR